MLSREALERGLQSEISTLGSWLASRPRFSGSLLVFAVLYGLLVNAWVADDAYITLRSVDQVLAGNGPRWNPHERVQAYTHPLWFWVLCGARLVVQHPFFAAIALGLVFSLLAIGLLYFAVQRQRGTAMAVIAVLAFLSSKSVMDYTTSGLENSLSYFLLIAALVLAWRLLEGPTQRHDGTFFGAFVALFLLMTNRLDTLPLILPLLVLLAAEHARRRGVWRTAMLLAASAIPLVASVAFSLFYYGLPLPNTVYAKMLDPVSLSTKLGRGFSYVLASALFDPLLVVVVVVGVSAAFASSSRYWRAVAAGILLQVTAIVAAGGDFMVGRFFNLVFLAALLAVVHFFGDRGASRLALGLMLFAFFPFHPLHPFADRYAANLVLGVADERAYYARHSSLEVCIEALIVGNDCPSHHWVQWGHELAQSQKRVAVVRSIGFLGQVAGLDKIVVDELALADAFLARMPLRPNAHRRVGHGIRAIPDGYVETLEQGENRLRDPNLRAYYEKLRVLTQAPLLAPGRLETILWFNLGRYDSLLEPAPPGKDEGRGATKTTTAGGSPP